MSYSFKNFTSIRPSVKSTAAVRVGAESPSMRLGSLLSPLLKGRCCGRTPNHPLPVCAQERDLIRLSLIDARSGMRT
jgi:hypothetical protein